MVMTEGQIDSAVPLLRLRRRLKEWLELSAPGRGAKVTAPQRYGSFDTTVELPYDIARSAVQLSLERTEGELLALGVALDQPPAPAAESPEEPPCTK